MSREASDSVSPTDILVGLITAPEAEADHIADVLVENGLAACCNVLSPVTSYFNWEGKRGSEKEALIIVKTIRSRSRELISKIKEIHPYDVPEVILLPVTDGLEGYLKWVMKECSH